MDKKQTDKTEIAKKIADSTNKISSNFSIIEEYFVKFFRFISSLIDNFMFSPRYIGLSSLLLALVLYYLLGMQDNSLTKALSSSKTLNSVNITTRYNSESFEVSGVPTRCDVIVTGDAASVSNTAANKNGYCLIDLEGYTEGTHYVKVNAFGYGDNVTATAVPSNAQITLRRKTTSQFQLSYDYINTNQLDSKFVLSEPIFENGADYVNIRASQETLNSISLVKALIDVKGQTADFTVDAPLVAYNARGQQVDAEIVPSTVKADVKISSYSKTVPITLNVKGEVLAGFAVDQVSMDQQSTVIYGLPEALEKIDTVYAELDLSTITSNTTLMQPITVPAGVTSSSIAVVNIKVVLDSAVNKVIEGVPLNYINNDGGYGAVADSLTVNVTLTGTSSTLEEITSDNINAYVDFKDLTPGTYDLPIYLEKKNTAALFSMKAKPELINITLTSSNN